MAQVPRHLVAPSGAENHQRQIRQFLWSHRSEKETDLVIISGKESFNVHRGVILPLSSHLMELLPASCSCTKPTVYLPPFSSHVLAAVLEMLYTGNTAIAACQEYWNQVREVFALLKINADIQKTSGEDNDGVVEGGVTAKMEQSAVENDNIVQNDDEKGHSPNHQNEKKIVHPRRVIRRCYLNELTGMFFCDENVSSLDEPNNCKNDEVPSTSSDAIKLEVKQEIDQNDTSIIPQNLEEIDLPQQDIQSYLNVENENTAGHNDIVPRGERNKLENVVSNSMSDDIQQIKMEENYKKDVVKNESERLKEGAHKSSLLPKKTYLEKSNDPGTEDRKLSSSSQNLKNPIFRMTKLKAKESDDIGKEQGGNIIPFDDNILLSGNILLSKSRHQTAIKKENKSFSTAAIKKEKMSVTTRSASNFAGTKKRKDSLIGRVKQERNRGKKWIRKTLKDYYKREGNNIVKCNLCSEVFYSVAFLSNFKHHMATVHKEKYKQDLEFVCDVCDAAFLTKNALTHHHERHEPAVICPNCDKSFATKISLRRHQTLFCKTAVDLKFCGVCGKGFKTSYHVKVHNERVHLNFRPYKCIICEKRFKSLDVFQAHCSGVHQLEKAKYKKYLVTVKPGENLIDAQNCKKEVFPNYSCDLCGRVFTERYDAKNHHERVHLNIRPHKCTICGKKFKSLNVFKTHCIGVHQLEKAKCKEYLLTEKPGEDLNEK